MTVTVEATYKDGVLRPKHKLKLADGAKVRVTITAADELDDDPLSKVIGSCKGGPPDGAHNHDKYIYGNARS